MKNLKRILSFFIVMGFMFVMFGFRVGVKADGNLTAIFTIASKTSVTPSGDVTNITSVYSQTYTTETGKATSGHSFTLTLSGSGIEGKAIKSIILSMHSNKSAGGGSMSVVAGTTTIASIEDSAFNTSNWYGAYSQNDFVDVAVDDVTNYAIGEAESVVITISATANSLYLQKYTIVYGEPASDPSVIINTPADSNLMLGNTLQFTSSAQNVGNIVTDVWTSSNTSAATVSSTGLVAPVALGTTNITRTVNGTVSNAISLKIWPSNASNISIATALAIAEFTGNTNSYFTYSSAGTVNNPETDSFTLSDGNDSITVYKPAHGFKSNDSVVVTGKLKNHNNSLLEYSSPTITGYTVTFDTNGGSPSYDTLTGLASGAKISSPGTPTRSGYTFNGWFNGNTEWDFDNDTVTSSITLTAKWASNAAQAAINNALESTNAYMSLAYGYTLNKIENPSTYTKVTSISHLSDGDSVIVVFTKSDSSCVALNTAIKSNKTTGTTVTVENDVILTGIEDSCCWTLIRNNDGTWKLKNETEYLYFTESNMSCGVTGSNLDLHITNTDSYFTATVNDKVRTAIYRDTYDIRSYAASNIGASGYSHVNLYVKQATAKYSVRDVKFRIRCAIDDSLAILNEDYAVTLGIEVTAGGQTRKYHNGASFQNGNGKFFVTLDLGDLLNTYYSNLDTEFTVRAYVVYQGAYFYSTNTKTYSVKGMVDYYYNNQHIDAVSEMKEILENYGYTFD